ncbi:MAG: UDP-N-acetylmuramoyl-L-alanyl-D-glutamate--2,6-diaminopimelate ligase [Chloroflexi bacterium]|nr:MAG: UDP-N-acetylmuramoyl-L-alanyl-D-glutamate--2,6-diaminopimelate ligase [Chloroflexota bacterium]
MRRMTTSPRGDWRQGLPSGALSDTLPATIGAVCFDSRAVRPGDLFVCVRGEQADGHTFARAAVEAGAVALVEEAGRGEALDGLGVPVVRVPDTRRALSSIAAAHEGYPARRLTVIGITGTDGKSTTAFLTLAALEACGLRAGLLTTIESRIAGRVIPNPTRLTTQEAPLVQSLLAEMVEAGCTHAIVEATSHGLALHRLDDCEFDVAVLTNLTEDHLDFHGTLDAYRAAKTRLFSMLDAPTTKRVSRAAVLNADDRSWETFGRATRVRRLTYALDNPRADILAGDVMLWPDGSTFVLTADEDELEASVHLPGRFNVANAAAAITVAAALGLDPFAAAAGVASCPGVPGRMEPIAGAPFPVIVDYAHTPDALAQVLSMLRPLVDGRLIVVFGCAGERARERRSGLGRVAAEQADLSILTDEDPRSESPMAIIDEIAAAMVAAGAKEGERFERIPGRGTAIMRACAVARPDDLVLIAGKGHESTIEWADHAEPWDDRAAARDAFAALGFAAPTAVPVVELAASEADMADDVDAEDAEDDEGGRA